MISLILKTYFFKVAGLRGYGDKKCQIHPYILTLLLQDANKYFFLYTIRKMRSTAFQPCKTLGGLHWAEMGQKNDFLKKRPKNSFLGGHDPG